MPFTRAGQLARPVPAARLTDPLGLVAENLRSSPHGVVPVLDRVTFGEGDLSERQARVLGLVDVRDLARVSSLVLTPVYSNGNSQNPFSRPGEEAAAPAPSFLNLTAREVMQADVPHIPSVFSLQNALSTLDRYEYSALPVLDETGAYRGFISRADILAALGNNVRPPMVGGMATPLGVWLTDGSLTGGAPQLGLFLTGLTLSVCHAISSVLLVAIMWALNPNWGAAALSGRIGMELDGSGGLNSLAFFLQSFLFLLALRLNPLAGIHAAEHQTVHAMERGLPLELEFVEKMPRAHPRCGSNLLALLGLVTIGIAHLPQLSPDWVMLVLIATFFGWRSFGTLLQQYGTTRPASKKQLLSGIKAGKELMEKYQAQPFATSARPLRLLNNGLIFAAAGMSTGMFTYLWLLNFVSQRIIH